MDDSTNETQATDVRMLVRGAIQEFISLQQSKAEPAYKAELVEERKRREQLEQKLNEVVEENRRSRMHAEEIERASTIKGALQRMGVTKVDLAFKALKEDIHRSEDGRLIARTETGDVPMKEYISRFINENPELLPARIAGGSGASSGQKVQSPGTGGFDLDKIRPGMSAEDLERVRQEISRIAGQPNR